VGRVADAVIVGGGPAGATTAIAIARAAPELAGRVVLLERARYPRDKPCAGALGARGDAILRALGVDAAVPSAWVDGMCVRTAEGEAVAAPGRIGRVVRRTELDHALARAAAASGVEVRDGVRVDAVEGSGERAVLRTSAGDLSARVVVGCDGVGSVVRKAMGLGAGGLRAQVVEVDTEPVASDRARSLLTFDLSDRSLAGYAWDFPTIVGGRQLVCRGVYQLRRGDGGGDGADVGERLAARLRAQGVDPASCTNKRYAERGFEPAERVAEGPLMLAGEAAGVDPVTGEGIAQAIEFGAMAGAFLADRLRGADARASTDGWADVVRASRLGRDLRIRAWLARHVYGARRAEAERFMTDSPDVLYVGCQHFAAHAYDWGRLLEVLGRGAARLLAVRIGEALGGRASQLTAPGG
jgi:flavin-dependent dehydrogenase